VRRHNNNRDTKRKNPCLQNGARNVIVVRNYFTWRHELCGKARLGNLGGEHRGMEMLI
jgi:hypothetical protein